MKKKNQKYQSSSEKKLHQLAFLFFVFCLAIIPFITLNTLIDPALLSRFSVLTFGLLVFLILYAIISYRAKSSVRLPHVKSPAFALLMLFLFFSGLSIINALNQPEAVFSFLQNSVLVIFFLFSTFLLVNTNISAASVTKTVVIFSSVIILIGWYQTGSLLPHKAITKGSASVITAFFMNKNLFAQMLFLTLVFNVYGTAVFTKRWKTLSAINSLLSLALVIVLQTRSVWLAILLSFIITSLFVMIYQYKRSDRLIVLNKRVIRPLIFIAGTVVLSVLFIILSEDIKSEKGRLTSENIVSSPGRIAMWKSSVEMFKDYPLLGVGGGNWKIYISKYGLYEKTKSREKKRFQRPHNDYLSILNENGIFGLLAFVGFLLIGLFSLIRIITLSNNKEEKLFYLFLFSGLSGYMVFSFFDFPKERTELNIYLFFILSLTAAKYQELKPPAFKNIAAKSFLFIILPFLLVLMMALFFGIKRINGEIQAKKAIEALHGGQFDIAIQGINKSYSRYYEMDPTSTPVLWYSGLANFRKGNKKEALRNFMDASLINPYHSHVYNSIGVLYASSGDFAKAGDYFSRSIKLRPYATETIINLARLHIQNEKYDSAYFELKKINPDNESVSFKVIMVKVLEHKIDQLADSIPDAKIHNYMLELKKSKPNTLNIYKTSVLEGRSFKAQFMRQVATNLIGHDKTLNQEEINVLKGFL